MREVRNVGLYYYADGTLMYGGNPVTENDIRMELYRKTQRITVGNPNYNGGI